MNHLRANLGRLDRNFRLLCCVLLIAVPLGAAATPIETIASQSETPDQRLTQPAFDRQIEHVLQSPEYNWRGRDGLNRDSTHRHQKSIVEQWMTSIRDMLISLGSWLGDLLKSFLKSFDLRAPNAQPEVSRTSWLWNALGYVLWVSFAGTLILLLVRILKLKSTKLPPSIVAPQKPDLAAEDIEANRLPANEWYALAQEKMAAGEFRQAQRALFLAILSYLALHRFITAERWKSNTDYEKELERTAKHPSELPTLFVESRLGFERCWYGSEPVTPEALENYNRIYERIKLAAA